MTKRQWRCNSEIILVTLVADWLRTSVASWFVAFDKQAHPCGVLSHISVFLFLHLFWSTLTSYSPPSLVAALSSSSSLPVEKVCGRSLSLSQHSGTWHRAVGARNAEQAVAGDQGRAGRGNLCFLCCCQINRKQESLKNDGQSSASALSVGKGLCIVSAWNTWSYKNTGFLQLCAPLGGKK